MKWEEIRTHYPKKWLLIEAIKAHSEANKRILDDIAVINVFNHSTKAMHNIMKIQNVSFLLSIRIKKRLISRYVNG